MGRAIRFAVAKKASGEIRTHNLRITNALLCQLKLHWLLTVRGKPGAGRLSSRSGAQKDHSRPTLKGSLAPGAKKTCVPKLSVGRKNTLFR